MAVYIIVALVAVAVLWAAYRSFGSGAAGAPDNALLLRRAYQAQRDADTALEPPGAAGKAARRTIDGAAQLLERVETAGLDERSASAHALLTNAGEDLSWAARLLEAATSGSNSALYEAAAALRDQARRCLAEAETLLPSGAAEEVGRPA